MTTCGWLPGIPSMLVLLSLAMAWPPAAVHTGPAGTWQSGGNMLVARTRHTAARLPDGTVLVAGGITGGLSNPATVSSAEIYDPAANTWTFTSSMSVARNRFTATLLPDGKVLVAGGSVNGPATGTAELYDYQTGAWSPTGSMHIARFYHTATRLPDGRVLVTGGQSVDDGQDNFVEKTAEIYDPGTGTWTLVDKMSVARYGHTATLLPDGTVLVAGGAGPRGDLVYTVRAEVYEPATDRWSSVDPLGTPRGFHTAALLNNGAVIVAGGLTLPANAPRRTNSAEIYLPAAGVWAYTGAMNLPRSAGALGGVVLADGRFLVAGGRTATTEIYDPAAQTWAPSGSMAGPRSFLVATLLSDGAVLVTGGENANGAIAAAEVYTP